jgi:hypothetical protein
MHSAGIDFEKLHAEGIAPIVARSEIDYKYPLRSRDRFVVCSNVHREGRLRFVFEQDIYRLIPLTRRTDHFEREDNWSLLAERSSCLAGQSDRRL